MCVAFCLGVFRLFSVPSRAALYVVVILVVWPFMLGWFEMGL